MLVKDFIEMLGKYDSNLPIYIYSKDFEGKLVLSDPTIIFMPKNAVENLLLITSIPDFISFSINVKTLL